MASHVRRIDSQIADLQRGTEQDVRKAALDLQSAAQQVTVTQSGLDLAQRELALAHDRFKNGSTDNIEVRVDSNALHGNRFEPAGLSDLHVGRRLNLSSWHR
jgi:outer membrane protein TolC